MPRLASGLHPRPFSTNTPTGAGTSSSWLQGSHTHWPTTPMTTRSPSSSPVPNTTLPSSSFDLATFMPGNPGSFSGQHHPLPPLAAPESSDPRSARSGKGLALSYCPAPDIESLCEEGVPLPELLAIGFKQIEQLAEDGLSADVVSDAIPIIANQLQYALWGGNAGDLVAKAAVALVRLSGSLPQHRAACTLGMRVVLDLAVRYPDAIPINVVAEMSGYVLLTHYVSYHPATPGAEDLQAAWTMVQALLGEERIAAAVSAVARPAACMLSCAVGLRRVAGVLASMLPMHGAVLQNC